MLTPHKRLACLRTADPLGHIVGKSDKWLLIPSCDSTVLVCLTSRPDILGLLRRPNQRKYPAGEFTAFAISGAGYFLAQNKSWPHSDRGIIGLPKVF